MSGYRYRGNNFTIEPPQPRRQKTPRAPSEAVPKPTKPARAFTTHCTLPHCNNPHEAKGYCHKHYTRQRFHGTTNPRPQPTYEQRFWNKVNKTPGCWEWTAALGGKGQYPQIGHPTRKTIYAHRQTWEWANGPIPQGQTLVRTCDNNRCVNPAHHQLRHHYSESKVAA